VIEFVLDGRSRASTYTQLVEQVKQALLVGLLSPGDRLPRVRDVAESLAINPNTVLKAYRELEIEGLVGGKPGVGTFVTAEAVPQLEGLAELRAEFVFWLRRAHEAGLTDEDVSALVDTTIRAERTRDGARARG
jgi:GntR family transcriptional regulator